MSSAIGGISARLLAFLELVCHEGLNNASMTLWFAKIAAAA
jgi:hypothetical protein